MSLDYKITKDDILNIFPNINFILYSDIPNINTIDELLGNKGMAIILYLFQEFSGHYVCLFKRTKNILSYFDSYGFQPDDDLIFIKPEVRKQHVEVDPILFELISNSGYRCEYNNYQLQRLSNDINTCGKHCIVRLYNRKLSPETYVKRLYSLGNDPDKIVNKLINKVLYN